MTDARIGGLVVQVPIVISPATISARLGGLVTQVVIYTVPIPTSVVATQTSSTSIGLSWAAPLDGKTLLRYEVQIDGGAPINKGSSLSHSFTGLAAYSTHEVGVRFLDTEGNVSEWAMRGLAILPAPSDNPFETTPFGYKGPVLNQPAKKTKPYVYIGDGVQVEDLTPATDTTARRNYPSEVIPIVQGGQNRRVALWEWLDPDMRDAFITTRVANSHPGNASQVNTLLTLATLGVGIWRFKFTCIENRSASSINGGAYFGYSGAGTVSRIVFLKRYVATSTGSRTSTVLGVTDATARKVEGGASKTQNVIMNSSAANDAGDCQTIYHGTIVVATGEILFTVIGQSGTGGGNNISFREGSSLQIQKMDV